MYEVGNEFRRLHARRALDARGHVHGAGASLLYGLTDIGWCQPARKYPGPGRLPALQHGPVHGLAVTAWTRCSGNGARLDDPGFAIALCRQICRGGH